MRAAECGFPASSSGGEEAAEFPAFEWFCAVGILMDADTFGGSVQVAVGRRSLTATQFLLGVSSFLNSYNCVVPFS